MRSRPGGRAIRQKGVSSVRKKSNLPQTKSDIYRIEKYMTGWI
jgi:hypothetical protein